MLKKWMVAMLMLALLAAEMGASAVEDRESLRAAYRAVGMFEGDPPYDVLPQVAAPYATGAVREAALDDALS